MKISVHGQARELAQVQRLMTEFRARFDRVMEQICYMAALQVFQDIRQIIPTSPAYRTYRNALRVVGVAGDPHSFGVQANPRAPKVETIDPKKTVIYISPKGRGGRASPAVYVLRKWGPWTVTTLPFVPERNKAKVVYRKVSPAFVQSVARRNKEQKHLWRRTMARVGRRAMTSKLSEIPRDAGRMPDFTLDAFRLEFGLNGARPRPHWRPALRKLARHGMRAISQNAHLIAALADATYQGWRSWRTPTVKVSQSEAQNLVPFQQRLGVFR